MHVRNEEDDNFHVTQSWSLAQNMLCYMTRTQTKLQISLFIILHCRKQHSFLYLQEIFLLYSCRNQLFFSYWQDISYILAGNISLIPFSWRKIYIFFITLAGNISHILEGKYRYLFFLYLQEISLIFLQEISLLFLILARKYQLSPTILSSHLALLFRKCFLTEYNISTEASAITLCGAF